MAKQRITRRVPGFPLMLGANRMMEGCNFAVEAPEEAEVSLLLYRKRAAEPSEEILLSREYHSGRICSVLLQDFHTDQYEYNFRIDGKVTQDPCAYRICGRERFGAPPEEDEHKLRCGFLPQESYDWEGDRGPDREYRDMILYKIHVRGYTKNRKASAGKRGTFQGLTEMIPYWKELGVNTIELMPCYEFPETEPPKQAEGLITERRKEGMVNYWGYTSGFYFAPKRSYCATKEPEKEFRDMVKALHKAGIACIMEMYFPAGARPLIALRALQFWKRFYHVDGFHLLGDGAPYDLAMKDSFLSGTKILAAGYDTESLYHGVRPKRRSFAEYNSGFLQDMRRFLKSDEGMVPGACYRIRRNPEDHAVINYMAFQDGFTLNDMVSYNDKHNEPNGENNSDGTSYNYSWNCGTEGPSRKLSIRQTRERQMRNAFAMLLFAQGVPMIYGGDEIANSQDGNNNAYCQDNPVGWVDWRGLKRQENLLAFVRKAIAFRKSHPVLHMEEETKESDYLAKGFPDISFHGTRAWFCNSENASRMLGVMYCGAYAQREDGSPDENIYIAYNFYWEASTFALPDLPAGMTWKKVMDTGDLSGDGFCEDSPEEYMKSVEVAPRSIVILTDGPQAGTSRDKNKAELREEKKNASVASLQNDNKA